jgi:septal ring factor EnvC (AmiA/AmiB activator)
LSQTEGSLGELNRSLTLKDEQLAKLESTQKSFQSLTEENNKLKNRLSQTEGSLGELNRSLTLKDEQLAKLDNSLNKTMTKDLKKKNNELKNKVEETESLLEDLKRSVTFRKQNSKNDTQEKERREETTEVVSLNKKTDRKDSLNDKPKTELEQKEIVELSINQWVNSWSSKDIEAYIASYAPEFKPSRGLSRNAWEKGRRKRLANPAFIKITLANVVVDLRGEDLAKIIFRQKYQSDTYSDEVDKEITVKMINDKWLITRERVQQ